MMESHTIKSEITEDEDHKGETTFKQKRHLMTLGLRKPLDCQIWKILLSFILISMDLKPRLSKTDTVMMTCSCLFV